MTVASWSTWRYVGQASTGESSSISSSPPSSCEFYASITGNFLHPTFICDLIHNMKLICRVKQHLNIHFIAWLKCPSWHQVIEKIPNPLFDIPDGSAWLWLSLTLTFRSDQRSNEIGTEGSMGTGGSTAGRMAAFHQQCWMVGVSTCHSLVIEFFYWLFVAHKSAQVGV